MSLALACHFLELSSMAPMDQLNLPLLQGGGVGINGGTVNFNSCHINNNQAKYVSARLLPFLELLSMAPMDQLHFAAIVGWWCSDCEWQC